MLKTSEVQAESMLGLRATNRFEFTGVDLI
jgi:hypothetical protein